MKDATKHIVHRSLIEVPTIAGISSGLFGGEVMVSILMFNFFRVSIISLLLIGFIFLVLHPIFRQAHKEDPLALQLWIYTAITGQGYYPGKSDINRRAGEAEHAIPTNL
jgi:type IV secretory pathway VirB3-like protein